MHVKTSESCLPRQMLNVLVVADWISCGHDFLQRIPTQYLYLAADQYFYNKHSPIEIRDSFLDLLGDVLFVVPGVVTAQCHRGESLSSTRCPATAGSQPSKASGCRNSCCLMAGPTPPFCSLGGREFPRMSGIYPCMPTCAITLPFRVQGQ